MRQKRRATGGDRPVALKIKKTKNNVPHGVAGCKHFRFRLRGSPGAAIRLLEDFPMEPARNKKDEQSRVRSINMILSNQVRGDELQVRNISREKGRVVLLDIFNHLADNGFTTRSEDTMTKSTIRYLPRSVNYLPNRIYYTPEAEIFYRLNKGEQLKVMNLDTPEKRELAARLRKWWAFIRQQEIKANLSQEDFDLLNKWQVEQHKKKPLEYPDQILCLPYFSFNNRKMTIGGRLYGSWWIGTSKLFRRGLTINGELTADVDGCGMHVQLLYRREGLPLPSGDPYIYTGDARDICKGLMLLMMNTGKDHYDIDKGRVAVAYTYMRNSHFQEAERKELFAYMRELEKFHNAIIDHLYKSNWGNLQMTEAQIMMRIMEAGMADGIPILPVHDGCICPRSAKVQVLQYFADENIKAAENRKHLLPLPMDEIQSAFQAVEKVESYV
jgi:hypothetical protein